VEGRNAQISANYFQSKLCSPAVEIYKYTSMYARVSHEPGPNIWPDCRDTTFWCTICKSLKLHICAHQKSMQHTRNALKSKLYQSSVNAAAVHDICIAFCVRVHPITDGLLPGKHYFWGVCETVFVTMLWERAPRTKSWKRRKHRIAAS